MSPAQAKRTATGVFIVVAAVVAWSEIADKGNPLPPAKTLVALIVLAAGLAVGVELIPEIIGPLALLMGLAIVISRIPTGPSKFLGKYTTPESSAVAPSGNGKPTVSFSPSGNGTFLANKPQG